MEISGREEKSAGKERRLAFFCQYGGSGAGAGMDAGSRKRYLAAKLGKAPSTISNKLRLLKLPEDVRLEITKAGLTERHARALLKLDNQAQMRRALSIIVERRLNVAETDKLIDQMLQNGIKPRKAPLKLFKDVRLFVNTLNHAVDTMRRAGIEADSVKSETEEYIEYVVRIPKSGGYVIRAKKPGVEHAEVS